MKNVSYALLTIVALLGLCSCATIVSGTNQKVSVTSQPSGAKVVADGKMNATTPAEFILERKSDHTLELSKEGYKSSTVLLKRTINGMLAGNILIGGIIGVGVDAVSGANNKLIPERVAVVLEEGEGISETPKFVAAKDAEFYEAHILKPRREAEKNKALKEAKDNEAPAKAELKTNFTPKSSIVSQEAAIAPKM